MHRKKHKMNLFSFFLGFKRLILPFFRGPGPFPAGAFPPATTGVGPKTTDPLGICRPAPVLILGFLFDTRDIGKKNPPPPPQKSSPFSPPSFSPPPPTAGGAQGPGAPPPHRRHREGPPIAGLGDPPPERGPLPPPTARGGIPPTGAGRGGRPKASPHRGPGGAAAALAKR